MQRAKKRNQGKSYTTWLKPKVNNLWHFLFSSSDSTHLSPIDHSDLPLTSRTQAYHRIRFHTPKVNLFQLPYYLTQHSPINAFQLLRVRMQCHELFPTHAPSLRWCLLFVLAETISSLPLYTHWVLPREIEENTCDDAVIMLFMVSWCFFVPLWLPGAALNTHLSSTLSANLYKWLPRQLSWETMQLLRSTSTGHRSSYPPPLPNTQRQ